MPLETASFISDLNVSNPSSTDRIAQGDDHIRLLKATLRATFPALAGAMTLSEKQLNSLPASIVPFGLIADWYGSADKVPAGWAVCNGQSVQKSDGSGNITLPDLRNRVTAGASDTYAPGAVRGSDQRTINTSSAGAHSHTAALPDHSHGASGLSASTDRATTGVSVSGSVKSDTAGGGTGRTFLSDPGLPVNDPGHSHGVSISGNTASAGAASVTTSAVGDHAHSVSFDVIQPTMALHKIMKI